jgi:hypothetical protein
VGEKVRIVRRFVFDKYLKGINKAYSRRDATEHTHRPALKGRIDGFLQWLKHPNVQKINLYGLTNGWTF